MRLTHCIVGSLFVSLGGLGCGGNLPRPADAALVDEQPPAVELLVAGPDLAFAGDLAAAPDVASPFPCMPGLASNLPGVAIVWRPSKCSFTLAEAAVGLQIPYDVVVKAALPGVIPVALDAGRCARPGASGLIVQERVEGNGQRYCVCDQGLCPPPAENPQTLPKGTVPATLAWDGRNWGGPSDTNRPKGAAFPPGTYRVVAIATGKLRTAMGDTPFEVTSAFEIRLVP